MMRLIEKILRDELEDGEADRENREQNDMMTAISPYEYIWPWKTYGERMDLARKLTVAIKGVDLTKLIRIPGREETEKFVKSIMPETYIDGKWQQLVDEEFIRHHALALRRWLATCDRFRKPWEQR